jgi:uncharacterized protein (TIGR03000 family)
MYSVVLMAALTAGSATPDCHRCCGCWGGYGCCGCYGGGWGGCYGGGWGGCYGGCYGACYGCWGGYAGWGCMGCLGSYYGAPTYPGSIYMGGTAGGTVVPGGTYPPGAEGLGAPVTDTDKDKDKGKSKDKDKDGRGSLSSNKAKLVVELPADAKLFIDDLPMKTTSGVRSFNTPALQPGQAYYYMVRVETMRDGKPLSETRRVIVRAGQTARADFKDLEADAVRTAQAK